MHGQLSLPRIAVTCAAAMAQAAFGGEEAQVQAEPVAPRAHILDVFFGLEADKLGATCIAALDHEYRSRVKGSSKCSPPLTFTCT